MNKKIPAAVLLASLTGEAILSMRHDSALAPQPHIETEMHIPAPTNVVPISASGGGRGGAPPATSIDFRQIS
jgi:hypothetical protein